MNQSIEVLLFAAIRDAAAMDTLTVPIHERSTAGDVLQTVAEQLPEVAAIVQVSRLAIDGTYVATDFHLVSANGDKPEFALIPPVSGG